MIKIGEVDTTIEQFSNSSNSELTINTHVASIEISHLKPDLKLAEFRQSIDSFNTEKLRYEAIYERALVTSALSRI